MKTLHNPRGDKLTLMFSDEGVLSSARLNGKDVTKRLRYFRAESYVECAEKFGFTEEAVACEVLQRVTMWLKTQGVNLLTARPDGDSTVILFLSTDVNGNCFSAPSAAVRFNTSAGKFIEVVWVDASLASHRVTHAYNWITFF